MGSGFKIDARRWSPENLVAVHRLIARISDAEKARVFDGILRRGLLVRMKTRANLSRAAVV